MNINKIEKRKVYGTILGVTLFVVLLLGITYAIYQWVSGTSNNTNVKLTVNKDIEKLIVYKQGNSILSTSNTTLEPSDTYSGGISATIEFYKKPTNKVIYGKINMEILNMLSATDTSDANIKKTDTIKWAITTYTINNSKETLLNEGTFNGKNINDKFAIHQDFELSTTRTYYKIYLWFDLNAIDEEKPVSGELLSTEISAEATDISGLYTSAETTLTNLGLTANTERLTTFTDTSQNDGTTGIYASEDDFGTSYYFRGNVENNYVYFAGYYWRIIRINGDGTVRMIYDGTSAHANGEASNDRQIGTSAYNENSDDNAYVGYMYGTAGSTTYEATHANTNDSTIKTYLDNWYNTNIKDTEYEQYIADAIYCNDRTRVTDSTKMSELDEYLGMDTVATGEGYEKKATYYGMLNRTTGDFGEITPTLKCNQVNDRFTKETSVNGIEGNGNLTNPIGLLTADEMVFAGSMTRWNSSTSSNNETYLYNGGASGSFWLLSPFYFDGSGADLGRGINGAIYSSVVGGTNAAKRGAVRPVITLISTALSEGTGTMDDPFKIATPKALKTLTNLGLTANTEVLTTFTDTSKNDGTMGIYASEDDFGTSYYFRGNVIDNYVYFAGYYWRIIRINGDGSIRMIYDGRSAKTNGETSDDRQVGIREFNDGEKDNTYVGYMYGKAGANTYKETHANTNDSVVKTYLDEWYNTNIKGTTYEQYIADAIYCNDRTIVTDSTKMSKIKEALVNAGYIYNGEPTAEGYGTTTPLYGILNRLSDDLTSITPSLKCEQINDRFTKETLVNGVEGNGKLSNPIGLITADEAIFGGLMIALNDESENKETYLSGEYYWTLSPFFTHDHGASSVAVIESNAIYGTGTSVSVNVRPVINLSSTTLFEGVGSMDEPFIVASS